MHVCDFTCTWINLIHISCTVYICLCVNFNPIALQLCVHQYMEMSSYIASQSKLVMGLYVYYVAGYSVCNRSAPELETTTR